MLEEHRVAAEFWVEDADAEQMFEGDEYHGGCQHWRPSTMMSEVA